MERNLKKNMYVQLSHLAMYLKLTQYYKSTILIIIFEKRILEKKKKKREFLAWYLKEATEDLPVWEWRNGGGK